MMHVFYHKQEEGYRVILIGDHYSHRLGYVEETLSELKKWNITLVSRDEVEFQTMAQPRYENMMGIFLLSSTKPEGEEVIELTPKCGLWEWLRIK